MNRKIISVFIALILTTTGFIWFHYFFGKKRLRTNTIERTLLLIKPDAIKAKNLGKIIDRIEQESFSIIDIRKIHLGREQAEKFYDEHRGKNFFSGLVDYMASGPIVVMILEKMNAVADLRDLLGVTDPKKAAEGTLRKQFGTDIRNNGIDGSDSHESALREIKFFFADRQK